jgi:hypothetical protein
MGPLYGGAVKGSFLIVVIPAVNRTNDGGSESAWIIAFNADGSASYVWQRLGTDFIQLMDGTGAPSGGASYAAPVWTCFVPSQNRTYMEFNGNHSPRWFDHSTNTYVQGTGTQRPRSPDNAESGIMFLVPERDILVFMQRSGGIIDIRTMSVGVGDTNPSWSTSARNLSSSIAVPSAWSAGCWCEDNQRIIVGMQTASNPAYNDSFTTSEALEIAIPANLADDWPVESAPFGSGQTITWVNAANVWKKWSYNVRAKAISIMQFALLSGNDVVYHYRPRNT